MRLIRSPRPHTARRRFPLPASPRALLHTACALFAALCIAAVTAQAAHAAPTAIAEGTVQWGVKASWRAYIGEAGITVSGGVTRAADGGFSWPVTAGSYDADSRALELSLGGTVHFTAHDGLLDTTMTNGRLLIGSGAAEVRYDVRSKTMDGTWVTLTDAPIALLDAEAVTPQVADGTTSWTAIPTAITREGSEAFTYGAGTALDALSIRYAGPGGAPDWAERWTAPGTYAFGLAQSRELLPGTTWAPWIRESFVDESAGVVHAVGYPDATATGDHLFAVDLATGAVVADAGPVSGQRYAFDAAGHTVFIGGAGGTALKAYEWDAGSRSYAAQTLHTGVTGSSVVFDAATRTVALANANGSVYLATRGGDGSFTSRTVAVTGFNSMGAFALDGEGGGLFTLSRGTDRLMQLDLGQPTATASVVRGLSGATYSILAVSRAGEAWAAGLVGGQPRLQRLTRVAGAWAPSGDPLVLPGFVASLRPSPDGRRLFGVFPYGNAVHVIEDGRLRGTVTTDGPVNSNDNMLQVTPRADGTLFAVHPHKTLLRPTPVAVPWVVDRYGLDAVSPAVTTQPHSETVTLGAAEESKAVELTVAATGTPAPAVQWQSRVGGVGRFRDVPGATAATLRVDAARDGDGAEYRAVLSNVAGELATEPARLTVLWPPRISQQPRSVSVVEGEDALLKVMPLGNPHPAVTWQVRAGGFWQDLGADSGDVELSGEGGGFLTVKKTTLDQNGTRLRARVANARGVVFSDVVQLAVTPAGGGAVTFGSGTVDWGFAERWRCYVIGSIARGGIDPGEGVARVPGSAASGGLCPAGDARSEALRFPVRGGSWDPATGRLVVRLGGSVRFWGHAHHVPGDTRPQLDTTFSNLRVVAEGGRGALYADASGSTMENPLPVTRLGVELVTVDLAGAPPAPTGSGLAWSAIPTALTTAGAAVFGSYPAGEPFDPLSLSLVYGTPQPDPGPDPGPGEQPQPRTDPQPQPQPEPKPAARAKAATVTAVSGRQLVGARRTARLATVGCPAGRGRCALAAPARVQVVIAGKRHSALVLAPKTVKARGRAEVRIQLTRAAATRLRGRTATVRVRLVVRAGKTVTRRTVTVRIGVRSGG